jgi:hypothetical protein
MSTSRAFKKYLEHKHVFLPDVTKVVADQLKTLRTSEPRRVQKPERSKDDGGSQGPVGKARQAGPALLVRVQCHLAASRTRCATAYVLVGPVGVEPTAR